MTDHGARNGRRTLTGGHSAGWSDLAAAGQRLHPPSAEDVEEVWPGAAPAGADHHYATAPRLDSTHIKQIRGGSQRSRGEGGFLLLLRRLPASLYPMFFRKPGACFSDRHLGRRRGKAGGTEHGELRFAGLCRSRRLPDVREGRRGGGESRPPRGSRSPSGGRRDRSTPAASGRRQGTPCRPGARRGSTWAPPRCPRDP
jgi:hypothetical protein